MKIRGQWDELLQVVIERLPKSKLNLVVVTLKWRHSSCFDKLRPEIGSVENIFFKLSKLSFWDYKQWDILQNIINAADKDSTQLLDTYKLKYHGFIAVNKIADRLCDIDPYSDYADEEMTVTKELARSLKLTKRIDNPISTGYIEEVWRECKMEHYIPSLRVMTDLINNAQSVAPIASSEVRMCMCYGCVHNYISLHCRLFKSIMQTYQIHKRTL